MRRRRELSDVRAAHELAGGVQGPEHEQTHGIHARLPNAVGIVFEADEITPWAKANPLPSADSTA